VAHPVDCDWPPEWQVRDPMLEMTRPALIALAAGVAELKKQEVAKETGEMPADDIIDNATKPTIQPVEDIQPPKRKIRGDKDEIHAEAEVRMRLNCRQRQNPHYPMFFFGFRL
jgi:hypothetical protein